MASITEKELQVLKSLGEYEVLEISQLAYLLDVSRQLVRRRIGVLLGDDLVREIGLFTGKRGRRSYVFAVTQAGANTLTRAGQAHYGHHFADRDRSSLVLHQLDVNWFRLHLVQLVKQLSELTSNYLPVSSQASFNITADRTLKKKVAPSVATERRPFELIPDGVFSLHHREQGKDLLFYLEVDRGTESMNGKHGSLRQKIASYQNHFRLKRYKEMEPKLRGTFNGFRLLFLVNDSKRRSSLCKLIREMPPSDFIWVCDKDTMFQHGLAGANWTRGGEEGHSLESIVGKSMSQPTPLPPAKA